MQEFMNAGVIHEHGGIDKLAFEQYSVPKIDHSEIFVEVKAAAFFFRELRIFGNFMRPKTGLKRACISSPRGSDPLVDTSPPLSEAAKSQERLRSENSLVRLFKP